MATLPPAPFPDPSEVPPEMCHDGCDERPRGTKSRFVPGHDGRLYGRALKAARDENSPYRDLALKVLSYHGWSFSEGPSPMAATRLDALAACGAALKQHVGSCEELREGLFRVGSSLVRVKGTSMSEEGSPWDVGSLGYVERREGFFLMHDVNVPDEFYVVPSDHACGALEGAHWQFVNEGAKQHGPEANPRHIENTLRRLRKGTVRMFKDRWDLVTARM